MTRREAIVAAVDAGRYAVLSSGPTPLQDSLTPLEQEMLEMIVNGLSNKDIVAVTGLSVNSVKSRIRSTYRKVGAETRGDAIEWASSRGYGSEQRQRSAG
jgi:DNA-binding CsgD family transcriptional regulator